MELKPCPFCGGIYPGIGLTTPTMYLKEIGGKEHFTQSMFWVRCFDCLAKTANYETMELAVEAWNRRAEGETE